MDTELKYTVAKWFAGLLVAAFLLSLLVPLFGRRSVRGNITIGISNARQIITALRLYAADHDGKYPDGETANQVFRELFKTGILENEELFGCPISPYHPNGKIGNPPNFPKAIEKGENHWAMTKGLTDTSEGFIPLVFENPLDPTWPPKWSPKIADESAKGRSWSGGKIIIGLNDSSVALQNLAAKTGPPVSLAPIDGEKLNPFEKATTPIPIPMVKVLDVE